MAIQTETPTDQTVEAAVQAAQNQITDEDDDYRAPEEVAQPAAAEAADPLEVEVPVERLSGYWKNQHLQGRKVTYKDLVEGQTQAEEKIRQQGERANSAVDQVKVLSSQIEVLQRQIAAALTPRTEPRKPAYEDVGLPDPTGEALRDPANFGMGTARLGAQMARAELDPRIANLEQGAMSVQNKLDILDVRTAADSAMRSVNAEPGEWQKLARYLYAAASTMEGGPKNSANWVAAYEDLNGIRPKVVASRTTMPVQGIVRGNPAGSGSPAPIQTTGKVKQRVRGLVNDTVERAVQNGLPRDVAERIAQETEEALRRKEAQG